MNPFAARRAGSEVLVAERSLTPMPTSATPRQRSSFTGARRSGRCAELLPSTSAFAERDPRIHGEGWVRLASMAVQVGAPYRTPESD